MRIESISRRNQCQNLIQSQFKQSSRDRVMHTSWYGCSHSKDKLRQKRRKKRYSWYESNSNQTNQSTLGLFSSYSVSNATQKQRTLNSHITCKSQFDFSYQSTQLPLAQDEPSKIGLWANVCLCLENTVMQPHFPVPKTQNKNKKQKQYDSFFHFKTKIK